LIRKKKRYILVKTDTEVSDLAIEIRKKIKLDYGDERFKFGLKIYVKTNKTAIIRINNLYIEDKKSPCGLKDKCEHCQKCMELITVYDVKKAIIRLL